MLLISSLSVSPSSGVKGGLRIRREIERKEELYSVVVTEVCERGTNAVYIHKGNLKGNIRVILYGKRR